MASILDQARAALAKPTRKPARRVRSAEELATEAIDNAANVENVRRNNRENAGNKPVVWTDEERRMQREIDDAQGDGEF
jgi:hypothetical protein